MLTTAKRIVIKLGTGVLTSGIGKLDTTRVTTLAIKSTHYASLALKSYLSAQAQWALAWENLSWRNVKGLSYLQACARRAEYFN